MAEPREYIYLDIVYTISKSLLTSLLAKEREGGSRPFGDRGSSMGGFDDDRQWRREGPLPTRDDGDRRGSGFGGGYERRESGEL